MGVWFTSSLKTKRWYDIEDTSDSIQGRYLPLIDFDTESFKFITKGIYYTHSHRHDTNSSFQRYIIEQTRKMQRK